MVRSISGLDLGLLALSRHDGAEDRAPGPAESEPGGLSLRRLDPELARLYLPPGRLAGESAPGGTMAARRVELTGGADLVSLGPAFHLDRMAVLRYERGRAADSAARKQVVEADDRAVRVLDASSLMEQVSRQTPSWCRACRASEAYQAMRPSAFPKEAPKPRS